MANKLDNVLDVIEAKLGDLVTAETVKAVQRGVVNPLEVVNPPVIGLVPGHAERVGGPNLTREWTASVLMMVCTKGKGAEAGQTITELMGEIEAALDGLPTDGTLGGTVDMGRFDFWYHAPTGGAVPVGAWAILTIKTTGSLKV